MGEVVNPRAREQGIPDAESLERGRDFTEKLMALWEQFMALHKLGLGSNKGVEFHTFGLKTPRMTVVPSAPIRVQHWGIDWGHSSQRKLGEPVQVESPLEVKSFRTKPFETGTIPVISATSPTVEMEPGYLGHDHADASFYTFEFTLGEHEIAIINQPPLRPTSSPSV